MGTSSLDDRTDLTEGATEGGVTLDTAEGEYEVTLRRTDTGAVTRHGEPYLSGDQGLVCARLFAFLGEDNPIRARVRAGKDLTDLLREPVDIEDIDAQIADLQNGRDSVMRRLETAERAADNLPSVKKAISRLESELEALEVPDEVTFGADIREREERIDDLEMRIDLLEGLHRANRRVLEEDEVRLVSTESANCPRTICDG